MIPGLSIWHTWDSHKHTMTLDFKELPNTVFSNVFNKVSMWFDNLLSKYSLAGHFGNLENNFKMLLFFLNLIVAFACWHKALLLSFSISSYPECQLIVPFLLKDTHWARRLLDISSVCQKGCFKEASLQKEERYERSSQFCPKQQTCLSCHCH